MAEFRILTPQEIFKLEHNIQQSGEISDAPMTAHALAKRLQKTPTSVMRRAAGFRDEHPDWFIRSQYGKSERTFLAPELVKLLIEELKFDGRVRRWEKMDRTEQPHVPSGWQRSSVLARSLGITVPALKKRAEPHIQNNVDQVHSYSTFYGRAELFYSPELVNLIKAQTDLIEKAPPGWLTETALGRKLKVSDSKIHRIVKILQEEHPGLYRSYLHRRGVHRIHFSPGFMSLVEARLFSAGEAVSGWQTNTEVAREIGRTFWTTKEVAEKYRSEHPDWFKTFRVKGKPEFEYYGPELIDCLKRQLATLPTPEGWNTRRSLATLLGIDVSKLNRLTSQLRVDHPEWFKTFYKRGRPFEHYAAEVTNNIRAQLGAITNPPEGWKSVVDVSLQLGCPYATLSYYIRRYENTHPNWSSTFQSSTQNRAVKYLHPELVSAISSLVKQDLAEPRGERRSRLTSDRLSVEQINNKFKDMLRQLEEDLG